MDAGATEIPVGSADVPAGTDDVPMGRSDALVDGVPATQANFVWLPLGERSTAFAAGCEARGVIVRPFAGEGVRVTIGTPAEDDRFLEAARALLG